MTVKGDTQSEAFRAYIQDKKILIADSSSTSRSNLAGVLVSLGAKTINIALASSLSDAQQEMDRVKPKIVIADYDLGNQCGLELIQQQRQHNPESKSNVFVLVTGNTSQPAVARSAEEDVDTYILKPFTPNILKMSMIKAVLTKVHPSDYLKAIDRGKDHLSKGKPDEAIVEFEAATKLDAAPSLAHFYLGQAHLLKELSQQAEGSYGAGLGFNKIHYKCLVGLYEILYSQKRYADAYDIVKKISQYFPANPQRLTAVLRLAIMTKSYEDVERYYQMFTKIDTRSEESIKYVCAALVVCGKYYLQGNFPSRAIELFNKAAVTASGRVKILREIILALLGQGMAREASEFLKRFPPETQSQPLYLGLDLLVQDKLNDSISQTIERGRKLISDGARDPLIHDLMIRRSIEAGLVDAAETLGEEAIRLWPEQKTEFEKLMQLAEHRRKEEEKKAE